MRCPSPAAGNRRQRRAKVSPLSWTDQGVSPEGPKKVPGREESRRRLTVSVIRGVVVVVVVDTWWFGWFWIGQAQQRELRDNHRLRGQAGREKRIERQC